MRAAVKELQDAGAVWDLALEASENAAPDPGFIDRLRAIAPAAERQHEALERAGSIPGYSWKPVPDAEDMVLSNELRPGGNRPGPEHLWSSFDLTVGCQSRVGVHLRADGADGGGAAATSGGGFVVSQRVVPGPGTLRVGRFIGRLGVVSLRAVEVGLDLDQRVVRRHVAKLEAVGWLARAPWVWGEGSVAWLTGTGVEGAGSAASEPSSRVRRRRRSRTASSSDGRQRESSAAAECGGRRASSRATASGGR